jgi:hypothetical protein
VPVETPARSARSLIVLICVIVPVPATNPSPADRAGCYADRQPALHAKVANMQLTHILALVQSIAFSEKPSLCIRAQGAGKTVAAMMRE